MSASLYVMYHAMSGRGRFMRANDLLKQHRNSARLPAKQAVLEINKRANLLLFVSRGDTAIIFLRSSRETPHRCYQHRKEVNPIFTIVTYPNVHDTMVR